MHRRWRRFIPRRKKNQLDAAAPLSTIQNIQDANTFIDLQKQQPEPIDDAAKRDYLLTLLIAQTPRAVNAQQQMDKHKHGYRNRDKRLYELIDFNDTFVSLVLITPQAELARLEHDIKAQMTAFCRRLKQPMFTDEQFDAIVKGLSREIAVYLGARAEGYRVHMTSRREDAFGIDMVITDQVGRQLNVDCKTPSAFRHRLEDMLHDGRITEPELLQADVDEYITTIQRRNDERIPVTILCIRPDTVGEVSNFTFINTKPLGSLLARAFDSIRET